MDYLLRLLAPGENVVHVTRKHVLTIASDILTTIVFAVLVGIGVWGAWLSIGEPALVGLSFLTLPLLWLAWRIVVWQHELFVVTSRRVIQLRGVVNKHSADSSLDKVNDVVLAQSLVGRLFNFGDIEVLTASEGGINRLHRIADPLGFKLAMLDAKQALQRPGRAVTEGGDASSLLVSLKALRDQGILDESEYQAKKADVLARM